MGSRHRTVRRGAVAALALAVVLVLAMAPGRAEAQDPFATTTTPTTTPAATSTPATAEGSTTTAEGAGASQTVVEAPEPTETALFTESRKIMAIIGALVCVALLLALLTVRYWRATKPVAATAAGEVEGDAVVEHGGLSGVDPVPSVEVPIAEPSSADHHGADADWEPRTGEHQRVDAPMARVVRPTAAARRAVLGQGAAPEGPDGPVASSHG